MPEPTTPTPFAQQTVSIACPDGVVRTVLNQQGRIWSQTQKVTVNIQPRNSASRTEADIQIIRPWEIKSFSTQSATIPPTIFDPSNPFLWSSLLPIVRDKILTWNRTVVAMPIIGESYVCVFRSDWLNDPNHQAAYSKKTGKALLPPETWEDYAQIAEYYAEAFKKPSLPSLPIQVDELDREFYSVASCFDRPARTDSTRNRSGEGDVSAAEQFSFHFHLDTLEPRINQPAFRDAVAWFQRIQPLRATASGEDSSEAFRNGTAVLALVSLEAVHRFSAPDSPIRERFDFVRLPGSTYYYEFTTQVKTELAQQVNRVPYLGAGGWLGVVRKDSAVSNAAFDLLAYLGNPNDAGPRILLTPEYGAGPYRSSQTDAMNRSFWEGYQLRKDVTAHLQEALRQMVPAGIINPVLRLRIQDEDQYRKALTDILPKVIQERLPAQPALDSVAKQWAAIAGKRPKEEFRQEIRTSLNLR
ncbi:hypothetical protein [Tuwongella immobilis]|nr:hypothetical protein [Tuwongella immobilis]